MPRRMNRTTGFTLVEMLVVMSIMVIVMGIMLPALMPLLGSKGVEGSAQKLMAVLMNARALAAREGEPVIVTFKMANSTPAVSRDWENCWYAVVKNPSAAELANTSDFNYKQVGPLYRLEEGCGFMGIATSLSAATSFDSAPKPNCNPSPIPIGYGDSLYISFASDGSASFRIGGTDHNSGSLYVVVSKEGTISSKSYYDTRLAVRVNAVTGLADVVSGH